MAPEIRKFVTYDEEVLIEGFRAAETPWRMFAVAAVVRNPWAGRFVDDLKPEIQSIGPRGASDAYLAPYHIERGKLYAKHRFTHTHLIDEDRIAAAIEFTRFPVPETSTYQVTETEPALVRAADLIGQIADPFYHRKIGGLYHEFAETGFAEKLGYETSMDLMEQFPSFFWQQVQPLIGPALRHLEQTMEGKQWVAQLYNHVFQVSHRASCLGPFPGGNSPKAIG